MSGATAARGATHAAEATARTGRQGWLASLQAEATSFLKGDNNSPWAILAETVIGCVPIVGQLVDARDIIKGLIEVSTAPASPIAWFNLITALIGVIPGGGDAVKRSLRAIKSRTVQIDGLLDMIRRLYRGNPEQLLREMLDVSKVRRYLNQILDNPALTRQVSPEVRNSIAVIKRNLDRQFAAFQQEVEGWLRRGRTTTADAVPAPRRATTPNTAPNSRTRTASESRQQHSNSASPNTPNASAQRTARFRSLTQRVLGILGEHMADYHCQDVKGWGTRAAHDQGARNNAKLNDGSHLVQLWPVLPRGRGIDAVWRSNGAKPYAIIEAKASYDPTKSLRALLGEAGDKAERSGAATGTGNARGGGAGRRARSGTGSTTATRRQLNGNVTQMSHAWIHRRLLNMQLADGVARERLVAGRQAAYTRHVLFFSIPQAVSHAEALIVHGSGRPVEHAFHAAHQVTREWRDSDIERVVDNRAGYEGTARHR